MRASKIRKRVLKLGIVIVVFAVLVSGGAYAYARYRYSQIPKLKHTGVLAAESGKPFDVLVAGTDSRAGLTAAQQKKYGNTIVAGGSRSDATMIVRVSPQSGKVALLSIPYDTFVHIAGTSGSNKISDALNYGPSALIKTIQENFHVPINAFVGVNFNGLEELVQALGGINVFFPYPSKDPKSGLNENSGCQLLNGSQALALARSRYFYYYKNGKWQYDPTSGFGRIHRQHTVIRAMIAKAKSEILGNPLALNSFIGTAVHDVTINNGLSLSSLIHLALTFRSFSSQNLNAMTLPTRIVNNYGAFGDVLFPVQSLDVKVISQFLATGSTPPPKPSIVSSSSTSTTSTTSTTVLSIPTPPPPPGGGGSIVQNRSRPSFDPTTC